MVKLYETGAYLLNGSELVPDDGQAQAVLASKGVQTSKEDASKNTMAYGILEAHNTSGNMEQLKIKFDKMTSHDITFVGIIQTARASGLTEFPIPYVLTNCHNSLCAVGGTINEDDHVFGLSCAKKYGGIYVPPHQAVIHQFAREMLAECGAMILGSDSHTRYGALGTMAIGDEKELKHSKAIPLKTTGIRIIKMEPFDSTHYLIINNAWKIKLLNKHTGEITDSPFGESSNAYDLYKDSSGHYWVSFYGQGVKCYNQDGQLLTSYNTRNSNLSNDIVLDITEWNKTICAQKYPVATISLEGRTGGI